MDNTRELYSALEEIRNEIYGPKPDSYKFTAIRPDSDPVIEFVEFDDDGLHCIYQVRNSSGYWNTYRIPIMKSRQEEMRYIYNVLLKNY